MLQEWWGEGTDLRLSRRIYNDLRGRERLQGTGFTVLRIDLNWSFGMKALTPLLDSSHIKVTKGRP